MRFQLFQRVALREDLPADRLKRGDIATIVEYHASSAGEDWYSLEVFNALGDTIAVVTVPETAIQPLSENDVLTVRHLAA